MGFLIDSSVLIGAERRAETLTELISALVRRLGNEELAISTMSAAELIHGCWRAPTTAIRARREEYVESLLATIPVAPVTLEVARVFGEIDARLSSTGRRIPTSDLLIASTALTRGDAIVTGDRRHFARVPGLKVHVLR